MTEKIKRRTSNPRTERLSVRVTKEEKQEINDLADRLELTLTDTILQGIEVLDEKYKLLKLKKF